MLHVIFDDHVTFGTRARPCSGTAFFMEARLPDGVVPRLAADGIPTGQIYLVHGRRTGFDLAELRSLQDWTIAPQLRSVAGVAEVASVGGFVAELVIQVDPGLLAACGLTIRELGDELSRPTDSVGGMCCTKATQNLSSR